MSYILDALKKSEKKRTRKRIPGVDALQNDAPGNAEFSLKNIIALVLAIAVANSAAIYLLFDDPQKQVLSPAPTERKQSATPLISDELLGNPVLDEEFPANPVMDKVDPRVEALPPRLDVTAHIYADQPDLRMVKIDGMNRHEGDYLADNHQLIKITEQGIILEYYGQRYSLDVVEDWQIN
ncbi:MAG: general secretion pathway protein GspB [Pseudomonadales bacterium]|nr:general secretion pathway protein GspB [Pseudomonadales bacterium]